MAAYLNDLALDSGLSWIDTNGTKLHLCSSQPANYAGIAAVELGSKTGITVSAAADGTPNGRAVTVSAITDGTVSANGSATHWAISNGSDTLVAANTLSDAQTVYSGNTFTLAAFTVRYPDPS